jgi:hypothetical protein
MKCVHLYAASFLLVAVPSLAHAQGTIAWDTGYPTATQPGVLMVKGTITLTSGWSADASVTISAWIDGQELIINGGGVSDTGDPLVKTFSGSIGNLASGVAHNVTVELIVTSATESKTLITEPRTATPQ